MRPYPQKKGEGKEDGIKITRKMQDTTKITLDTETYFKLVALKVRLKTKTWKETIAKNERILDECEKKKYEPVF